MNEFKFSCPNCRQSIQATPEYAGVQINCPSCQTAIVVPQATEAPAARPGKLTKAPSTVEHAATSPVIATTIVRKAKKPRTILYVKLGAGLAALAAAAYFAPNLYDKYQHHKETVLAEQAATNAPPPPPPELTADEILKKLGATYKELTSYGAQGDSVGDLDMSEINPLFKERLHPTAKLSILLGRGAHYRIEWERQAGPKTLKGAAWSAGKGDFIRTGTAPTKVKNWQSALIAAEASSGTLGVGLADLFFDATNSVTVLLKNYSKTNNESINGHKCYVVTGQIASQNILLWVEKDDFLIEQMEMVLTGKIDAEALAALPAAQKAQAQVMSKIKGNIIETYKDIETNKVLNAEAFQTAFTANTFTPNTTPKRNPSPGRPRAKPQ
jgi:hypothetical protein